MNLKSIRWKLPLTYAGIALITALVLGGTLLLIVRRYYQVQEMSYLGKNAIAISSAVEPFFARDPITSVPDDLKSHLSLLSFLSQTRISLYDPQGNEIASFSFVGQQNPKAVLSAISLPNPAGGSSGGLSGPVTTAGNNSGSGMIGIQVFQANPAAGSNTTTSGSSSGSVQATPAPDTSTGGSSSGNIQVAPGSDTGGSPGTGNIQVTPNSLKIITLTAGASPDDKTTQVILSQIPVVNTMYGVDLQGGAPVSAARSDQVFRQPIAAADGTLLGSVELSDGPAYGMIIVTNVAFGWLIASLVGILIAAGAGLWISRRMSAPLLVLTASTERMSAGDLSARAALHGGDEIGLLARSFNTMAGRVEETILALRHFVADAAPELQTPLTALRTNLELASGEGEAARQAAYLESAQDQVTRLNHLVRELLDLSRLEAGVDGQKVALDLAAFVEQLTEPYAAQAEQAGIELKVALPDQKMTVCAEEKQLHHAVGNLLENALKFTPAGGEVTVELAHACSSGQVQPEGDWACLSVADTGIGIPPEDVAGLFQRFHRGHNAAAYPGSGLGLAIVQAVAQAHGGQVIYAPNQPAGSRFTLRLPVEF